MSKKWIWIVVGIVVVAGVGYGAYWLGGKNALSDFAGWLNSNENKSQAAACRDSGGHSVCWSSNGLKIISVDGGCPFSGC